eukprot:4666377-Pyramimonas_sp.AAC.1
MKIESTHGALKRLCHLRVVPARTWVVMNIRWHLVVGRKEIRVGGLEVLSLEAFATAVLAARLPYTFALHLAGLSG